MLFTRRMIFSCLGAIALAGCHSLQRPDDPAREHCADSAEVVRTAKRAYQLGHDLPDGARVTWEELASCLPASWKPLCWAGGTLDPGALGQEMKCSVHGQPGGTADSRRSGEQRK